MARIKVSKRSQAPQNFVLKPSRVRMFAIYVALFGLAFGAGLLVRLLFNRSSPDLTQVQTAWQAYVAIIVGGPVLLALMDYQRWVMRVVESDRLEGASGPFGERAAIALDQIDWPRTRKSLASRFRIGNGIYARKGERVLINPWFYAPSAFREFLQLIGMPKE